MTRLSKVYLERQRREIAQTPVHVPIKSRLLMAQHKWSIEGMMDEWDEKSPEFKAIMRVLHDG